MRNSQSLPPQQAQVQAAQQAQVAAWQAAQRQAQEQAAAQQQAAAQAQAQAQAQAAAQAQAQQAAEYAAWQAQQEQLMQQSYYPPSLPALSGRAVGSLVCGILAILFFAVPLVGLVLAIVAIVLALRSNKLFGKTGTSKGGLVCGIVGAVLSVVTVVATVLLTLTLMQAIDEGELGFNFDAVFNPSYAAQSSGSSSGFDYSSYLNADEQEAYNAVNDRLAAIQSNDAQTLQEIATTVDQSFQQAYGTSMQSCGIDPTTYMQSMTANFSYDIDTVVVADTADGRSYVTASLSCRDVSDVKAKFDESLSSLDSGANLGSITSEDAKAQVSQAFISAVNDARFSAGTVFTVNVTQASGSWAVDQNSWNQQITQVFGFA